MTEAITIYFNRVGEEKDFFSMSVPSFPTFRKGDTIQLAVEVHPFFENQWESKKDYKIKFLVEDIETCFKTLYSHRAIDFSWVNVTVTEIKE